MVCNAAWAFRGNSTYACTSASSGVAWLVAIVVLYLYISSSASVSPAPQRWCRCQRISVGQGDPMVVHITITHCNVPSWWQSGQVSKSGNRPAVRRLIHIPGWIATADEEGRIGVWGEKQYAAIWRSRETGQELEGSSHMDDDRCLSSES